MRTIVDVGEVEYRFQVRIRLAHATLKLYMCWRWDHLFWYRNRQQLFQYAVLCGFVQFLAKSVSWVPILGEPQSTIHH